MRERQLSRQIFRAFSACCFGLSLVSCVAAQEARQTSNTEANRLALYEELVASIMETEAFSPTKIERMGVSYPEDFERLRETFRAADDDEALFYAIVKLSNLRHDRHLAVSPVEGGLKIDTEASVEAYGAYRRGCRARRGRSPAAPIAFAYEIEGETAETIHLAQNADLFVSAPPIEFGFETNSGIELGDTLIAINGKAIEAYVAETLPYHCHSTRLGYWQSLATAIPLRSRLLPPEYYAENLSLSLQRESGETYEIELPYLTEDPWQEATNPEAEYSGYDQVMDRQNFKLHRHETEPRFILEWLDFEDELLEDVDALISYAAETDALGFDMILDARGSSGGSRGAYAIQRLVDEPFKTTFGNIRISPRALDWASGAIANLEQNIQQMDGDSPELVGDPSWLLDWLKTDVMNAASAGLAYSNNVPFKTAHAPKWHYGILEPAETTFTGNLVCVFGPQGGSHLDQMAAILKDNDLCTMIGMPAGGYSNTWEAREVLTWPGTDEPIVEFMWNIGDTIRPNGEILEGNPAEMEVYVPITRENVSTYKNALIEHAEEILEVARAPE